jgi:GNAT superfamily N-acetyltransferase
MVGNKKVPRQNLNRSRSHPRESFRLRRATIDDLPLLIRHRHMMWSDVGNRTEKEITLHDRRYRKWAREQMEGRKLLGLIAESSKAGPVASGCLWFQPDHPRPVIKEMDSPYIMSMFTEQAFRKHGLATKIVKGLVDIARKKGYARVVLHASSKGRRVYSKLGFESTPEMRYYIDERKHRHGHKKR